MNAWILTLVMASNPNGFYTKSFDTEQACTQAMYDLIERTEKDTEGKVERIACLPELTLAQLTGE